MIDFHIVQYLYRSRYLFVINENTDVSIYENEKKI